MDFCQFDRRFVRRREFQFFRFVMILPVLVVDFELRTFLFHQVQLGWIQLSKCLDTMRAVIVWALVNGYFFLRFPSKERQPAIGTEELRLSVFVEAFLKLGEMRTNLAENLRALFAVVEVKIDAWRATARTDDMRRNR